MNKNIFSVDFTVIYRIGFVQLCSIQRIPCSRIGANLFTKVEEGKKQNKTHTQTQFSFFFSLIEASMNRKLGRKKLMWVFFCCCCVRKHSKEEDKAMRESENFINVNNNVTYYRTIAYQNEIQKKRIWRNHKIKNHCMRLCVHYEWHVSTGRMNTVRCTNG